MDDILIILDNVSQSSFAEKDLVNLDKMIKRCKFSEIVNLIKHDYIPKLTSSNDQSDFLFQIILSIYIFSLLKLQKYDQISDVYNKYKFEKNKVLFPFRFLEAKYYFMINDVPSSLNIYYKLLNIYSYPEENKYIVNLESRCELKYLKEIFVNLFAINNTENKIKKCYFEIKNCFIKLGLIQEAFKIISKCWEKYSNDVIVSYELLKQSIILSNFQKVEEIFIKMKESYQSSPDEDTKIIYENYLNFAEALTWISKGEYEIAKSKLTEILRNNPDNVIIINNIAALNLYLNKADKSYSDFRIILDKDQMNSFNEITFGNINILSDVYNLPKYP